MTTPVNGMFYIDNLTRDFYLREAGAWVYKGTFGVGAGGGSNIFEGDGPPPAGGDVGQEIIVGTGAPS